MYLFLENDQKSPTSNLWCTLCNVPYVNRDCFKNCHENEDIYLDEK